MRLILRILVSLSLPLALLTAAALPASAATLHCPKPYLITGYGDISWCTNFASNGTTAQVGFYSPITKVFEPSLKLPVISVKNDFPRKVAATDGMTGLFKGSGILETAYGPATYGIQYTYYGFQPIGRWGAYNHVTDQFYPDSDWHHANGDFQ